MADISRVIVTGGRETGGLHSFAATLADGFDQLGIPAEVIRPSQAFTRVGELRDPSILKILSTTAVFAAPLSKRTICIAHGFPRIDAQARTTVLALVASFKMLSLLSSTRLVAISHYAASHLKALYNIEVDGVVHNPLNSIFFEPFENNAERMCLTYVGRLHPVKNIDKLLPAMIAVLDEHPGLRIRIVGDGVQRSYLRNRFGRDPRVEFTGDMDSSSVRNVLRTTKVFISGCETEALGIAYLEALSQGCSVVMPACGGGMEIAPEHIGNQIQLIPLSLDQGKIQSAISRALDICNRTVMLDAYQAKTVADQYLKIAATIP